MNVSEVLGPLGAAQEIGRQLFTVLPGPGAEPAPVVVDQAGIGPQRGGQ